MLAASDRYRCMNLLEFDAETSGELKGYGGTQ